jgi:hypothetical protein
MPKPMAAIAASQTGDALPGLTRNCGEERRRGGVRRATGSADLPNSRYPMTSSGQAGWAARPAVGPGLGSRRRHGRHAGNAQTGPLGAPCRGCRGNQCRGCHRDAAQHAVTLAGRGIARDGAIGRVAMGSDRAHARPVACRFRCGQVHAGAHPTGAHQNQAQEPSEWCVGAADHGAHQFTQPDQPIEGRRSRWPMSTDLACGMARRTIRRFPGPYFSCLT